MRHFLFIDNETGEEFLVGADNQYDAYDVIELLFMDPEFIREVSEFEAEMSGLDEY